MNYIKFQKELKKLSKKYSLYQIGQTFFKRKIYALVVKGKNSKDNIIVVGSIHAREHITCDLLLEIIKNNLEPCNANIWFIPMLNPDGVELCEKGIKSIPPPQQNSVLKMNNNSLDFSKWKSNARGVDINNNFDAGFNKNFKHKKTIASSQGYYGKYPQSEEESKTLVNLTKKLNPLLTLSFHTKGEEIYFEYYNGKNYDRDKKIADIFSKELGYPIKNVQNHSSGGYKDWCIEKQKICSLTIEVGNDNLSHPIKRKYLEKIYSQNKNLFSLINQSIKIIKAKDC